MTKRFLLLVLFLFSAKLNFPQPDNFLLKGNHLSYNLEFSKAEEFFNKEISLHPDSPAPFYFLARNYLWKYLGGRQKENAIIFRKYLNIALKKGEARLKNSDKDKWTYYYLGSTYMLKSAFASTEAKAFQAFWDTKKSVSYFEEALSLDNNFNDALLGLGVFDYALSFVPGMLKFALDLTGLDYSKDKAIVLLKKVYANSIFSSDEAAYHLSKIYLEYLADYDSASYYINRVIRKYPRNILFKYQKALIKIEQRQLDKAEVLLNKIAGSKTSELGQTIAFSYFLLGDIAFKKNNFKLSIKYFDKFFKSTRIVDYLGYANLRAAIAYAMLGDKENFNRHLELCSLGAKKIQEDVFANYASEHYLANGFTKEDSLVQILQNFYDAGKSRQCFNLSEKFLPLIKDSEAKATALTIQAQCLSDLKKYEEAIKVAKQALKENFDFKNWLRTLNYITLARAELGSNNLTAAENYLEKAKESNEGFFKNKLDAKINRVKRELEKHR